MVPRTALKLAAILAAVAAGAQAPTPSATPPPVQVFPTGVELVTVDVVVLDRHGRPVATLRPEDFRLLEDGRQQTISNFEVVQPAVTSTEPGATSGRPSATAESEPARGAGAFIIVFDELHLSARTAERAQRSVRDFLETAVREGDEVTLVGTSGGTVQTARLPGGRDDLLAGLASLRGALLPDTSPERLSDYEALRIQVFGDVRVEERVRARMDAERSGRSTDRRNVGPARRAADEARQSGSEKKEGDPQVRLRAAEVHSRASARTTAVLGLIERLVESLARAGGRKVLLLVSEGFVYDPTLEGTARLLTACLRANVVLYFLDARGLKTDLTSGAEHGGPPATHQTTEPQFADRSESGGSEYLATETGGETLRNRNTFSSDIAQIAERARSYYLLGYRPSGASKPAAFRKIEVRVDRKDVVVRARRGYYATGEGVVARTPRPAEAIAVPDPQPVHSLGAVDNAETLSRGVDQYVAIVAEYRKGDPDAAVDTILQWPRDRIDRLLEAIRAMERLPDPSGSPCPADCALAAALLHTEAAAREGPESVRGSSHHREAAASLIQALPPRADSMGVDRLWRLVIGYLFARSFQLSDAESAFEACRKRHGDDADVELALGAVHEAAAFVGRPDSDVPRTTANTAPDLTLRRAEAAYEKAVKLDPSREEAHLHLGRVLMERERLAAAERELRWVVDHGPTPGARSLAHLFLGDIAERRGNLTEAISHYREALDAQSGSQSARLALSQALLVSGDAQGASEVVRTGLELDRPLLDPWLAYRFVAHERVEALIQTLRSQVRR